LTPANTVTISDNQQYYSGTLETARQIDRHTHTQQSNDTSTGYVRQHHKTVIERFTITACTGNGHC